MTEQFNGYLVDLIILGVFALIMFLTKDKHDD